MKNLFKKAHEMTREIVNKYNDVDYAAQFKLCVEYLAEEKEVELAELKGSKKQIAWATDIRAKMLNKINNVSIDAKFEKVFSTISNKMTAAQAIDILKNKIVKIESAELFINKRYLNIFELLLDEELNVLELVKEDEEKILSIFNSRNEIAYVTKKAGNIEVTVNDSVEVFEDRAEAIKKATELLKAGYKVAANKIALRNQIKANFKLI